MAPPLSGRTRVWEAVREVRARTDRVSLSRGCLGCGLGRNIVGRAPWAIAPLVVLIVVIAVRDP